MIDPSGRKYVYSNEGLYDHIHHYIIIVIIMLMKRRNGRLMIVAGKLDR